MDFLLKALANFLANVLRGLLDTVLTGFITLFQSLVKSYTTHGMVVSAHNTVLGVSISLIVLFCVKQYFNTYIMETSGDPDADPLDILVRGSQATAIASCSTWIFYTFMNFCSLFAEEIINGTEESTEFTTTVNSVLSALTLNITSSGFIWLIFIATMIIGVFAFYVVATIRALELAMMYIILPFFCVELCYANHERFNGLITNIVVTGLYFVLQLIMFLLFSSQMISALTGVTAESTMQPDILVALGFMIVMLRSPKWLDKFVYNSGIGDTTKRSASLVGTSAVRAWFYKR